MTQTTTPTAPSLDPNVRLHLSDTILLNLIVALLAPMFLGVTAGDIGMARMAAIETVNAYRAQSLADLIAVAQIIGFGLAALGSLSLSMDDDISLSMTLRLRGNANAMNRSAEQNRRAIKAGRNNDPVPQRVAEAAEPDTRTMIAENDDQSGAEAFLNEAAEKALAAEARDRLVRPAEQTVDRAPVPPPAQVRAPTIAPTTSEKRHQEMWAIVMAKAASEISASIPGLPPAERRAASIRAGMLSSSANQLLTGVDARAPSFGVTGGEQPAQRFPSP
jgi:hypothetical protein